MGLISAFRRQSIVTAEFSSVDEQIAELEQPASIDLNDPILGMAIRNEEIRQEFGGLMEQFQHLDLLKGRLTSSISRFASVVDELEASRREAAELRTAVDLETSRTEELHREIARLEPELAHLTDERASLTAQVKRLSGRVETLEADFERERLDRQGAFDTLTVRSEELAVSRAQVAAFEDEMSAARVELDRLTADLASRDIELERTASALQHAEEHERMLKNLLDVSTSQNARLSRQLSELEPAIERYKAQISQLQSAVEEERYAKEQASVDRIEGLELLRTELKGSNAKLEAALARADTHERMLNESRSNYREKLEELRASERRAIDLSMQLANAQRRSEAAEKESEGAHGRLSTLETERRQYNAHLDALTKALAEKEAEIVMANDRTTFVTARLEESQRAARAERERFESDFTVMTHLFDKERVDRTLLEGALQSARRYNQALARERHVGEGILEGDEGSNGTIIDRDEMPLLDQSIEDASDIVGPPSDEEPVGLASEAVFDDVEGNAPSESSMVEPETQNAVLH